MSMSLCVRWLKAPSINDPERAFEWPNARRLCKDLRRRGICDIHAAVCKPLKRLTQTASLPLAARAAFLRETGEHRTYSRSDNPMRGNGAQPVQFFSNSPTERRARAAGVCTLGTGVRFMTMMTHTNKMQRKGDQECDAEERDCRVRILR